MNPRDDIARLITRELTAAADRIADAIATEYNLGDARVDEQRYGPSPKLLFNAVEAGEFLGCSDTTIRILWREGGLPFVRIGRGRKVTRQMLEDYVTEHAE